MPSTDENVTTSVGNRSFQALHSSLAVCALLSFLALAYPIYVIRPFRHQGSKELAVALAVLRFRPILEVILVIIAAALAVLVWQQSSGLMRRSVAVFSALLVVIFAFFSRVNVYELMFHPMDRPSFSPVSQTKLDGNEGVIAVHIGRSARAYPIRSLSYHHIVNDLLGGMPIVATY
jgi:hypothetical protein